MILTAGGIDLHEVCQRCQKDCKKDFTPWSGCMPDQEYCSKFKLDAQAAVEQAYQEGRRHPDETVWAKREELVEEIRKRVNQGVTKFLPHALVDIIRTHGLQRVDP